MLNRLIKLLTRFPIKSIFMTVIIIVFLVIGVGNIFMATGNDTFVKSNTDVYQDNLMLEEEFGGESIIVMYESDNLLTPHNLAHMKGLEDAIHMSDSIYSVLSPVTLVEKIANEQGGKFQEGIEEIFDGLDTMGSKLIDIGTEMGEKAKDNQQLEFPEQGGLDIPDFGEIQLPVSDGIKLPQLNNPTLPKFQEIDFPSIEGELAELNKGFAQLIAVQENLGDGTEGLVNGYVQFGTKTKELADNLGLMAEQMTDNREQAKQVTEISERLNQVSEQMINVSIDTTQLLEISPQTIKGLQNIEQQLTQQLHDQKEQQNQIKREQTKLQENMQVKLQKEQAEQEEKMKQTLEQQLTKQKKLQKDMKKQQDEKQEIIKNDMLSQQKEKEQEMQIFQENMQGKMDEQVANLSDLSAGLIEMGESLQEISENMETIHDYADIMTPGLPTNQTTLDNMLYDDNELRPMFEEVVIDESYMLMMVRFDGATTDDEKAEVIEMINQYLNSEQIESAETLVSGKPVLDMAIRSSMQENIQKMMGLALIIMVGILFIIFKVQWRILPLFIVLLAVVGTVGVMGWLQIPITMVSMAVFPILIGLGIDYAIQFQNRYNEELLKEDENE